MVKQLIYMWRQKISNQQRGQIIELCKHVVIKAFRHYKHFSFLSKKKKKIY